LSETYFQAIKKTFAEAGDPMVAQQQMMYLKGKFEFFGLKMPKWMAITRQFHKLYAFPEEKNFKALIRLCFEDEHREMHYFALETLHVRLHTLPAADIDFLEELICTQSWWDSVDWLSKLVGLHFKKHPTLILPVTTRWMASNNMWLQRASIIFQLSYKNNTDANLLFAYVRQVSHSKEFFLQKASGWALRQYAKTAPDAVKLFLSQTPVSPLTRREASKNLYTP
jgi:3-methyladenine DNA glycosylase AlkD